MYNERAEQEIRAQLKEHDVDLEGIEIANWSYDQEVNMGNMTLDVDQEGFSGNITLENKEGHLIFVLDLNGKGEVKNVELFSPAPDWIERNTTTFGYNLEADEMNEEFGEAIKTIKKLWKRK